MEENKREVESPPHGAILPFGEGEPAAAPKSRMRDYYYENHPLSQSEVAKEMAESPDALYGDNPPENVRIKEKPEHAMMIFLKAQGLSNREIATRMGYTPVCVSNVLRQPWARKRLMKELTQVGRDAVQQVLDASAMDSLMTLIEIRDDGDAPKAVRRAAAADLLDRVLGKAVQRTEAKVMTIDADKVQRELMEIDRQLNGECGSVVIEAKENPS